MYWHMREKNPMADLAFDIVDNSISELFKYVKYSSVQYEYADDVFVLQ